MKVFIAAKLRCERQQLINKEIYDACRSLGFEGYLPQIELPLTTSATPEEILRANEKAIDESDIVVISFDNAGAGCAMELERARFLNKIIIGFRKEKTNLGKMLEGAWAAIPHKLRVASVQALKRLLAEISSDAAENKPILSCHEKEAAVGGEGVL